MTTSSPISLCCAQGKDEGLYICGAFELLAELQNSFLKQVITLAAAGCPSLLYVKTGDTEATIRACSLNELRETDVIKYEWSDGILKYAQLNLEFGKGKEIVYNYEKIELELAYSLVSGKCIVDMEEMKEFEFHRELFHGFSTILQDIRSKVPQEKLPYSKVEALKSDTRVADSATSILSALEVVLTYLKKTGTTKTTQTIGEFCHLWQLDPATLSHLKASSLLDVQLQHVICLYEEVEDVSANKVAEWVDRAYTKPLQETVKYDFEKFYSQFPAQALVVTFRRFIFRFLSVDKISQEAILADYLPNLLLCWPHEVAVDESQIAEKFPRSLQLAHSYSAYSLLRDKLEKKPISANEKVLATKKPTIARRRNEFSAM